MADFQNLLGSVAGIFQQVTAANITASAAQSQAQSILVGGDIAAQGALLSAQGFRESARAVQAATGFNLAVDKMNLQRQLQATSRQFQRALGAQQVQAAGKGISVGSKSFLELRNETLDVFNQSMLNLKLDAENTRRAKAFESEVKQVNLENQARAAEYRADTERVLASNRAAEAAFQGEIAKFKAKQSIARSIPTIASQLFQG